MGSDYGSPEGDKLDVLVTLVEVYEDEHYPIPLKTDNSDKYPKVPSPKRSGGIFDWAFLQLEHENLQVPEAITYPQGKLKNELITIYMLIYNFDSRRVIGEGGRGLEST